MTPRILILLALFAAVPAWSQATGTGTVSTDEQPDSPLANDGMLTPPPVSGQAFPVLTGAEERSNYLNLGVTANVAYDDNVEGGYTGVSKGDVIYSIWPSVSLNRDSLRVREIFNYSPGFTFYQPSTIFNASDQSATGDFQYLMGTHTTLDLQDSFSRTSSLFNSPFTSTQGGVTGGVPTQTTGAVAAFAERILNNATAQLSNQTGENGMVGLSAGYQQLDYPDTSEVQGLFNATSWEGSAFTTQRINSRQYLGANVQHARIVSYLNTTDNVMQRDNIFGFYTIYLRNLKQSTLSLSVTGGPEHYSITQYPQALLSKWTASGTVSLGWQAHVSSASASFSHVVTGGGGLSGAYEEDGAQASYRRRLSPTWDLSATALYSLNKSVTPQYAFSEPGGHTIAAGGSADHMLSKNLKFSIGYDWMDQSYKSVVALSPLPFSNREYGSISYQFTRPIGR
ncbi:MAG TPA: hypothetical protein VHZ25_11985 [Acidobacteriaceae bacterium]|jgi:hypothetical protein|nr:hypothetical protein [Acidobacteriaceae bacterium]